MSSTRCAIARLRLRPAFHPRLTHGVYFAQAVSSQQHLFADSSMCGGRAHLFDLEVLNLTYYGSSVWTVNKVGNLPLGGVSMALLDTLGNCERCDASNVASSRPNANPLGTIAAEAAVANGALAWTRLRWEFTAEEVKPGVVKSIARPATKPAVKLEVLELASSGSSATSASFKSTLGGVDLNVGGGMLLSIGPAKARKGGLNREPRTKLSRRLRVTLHFLSDRDNAPRSKQLPKPAASFKAPVFTLKASGASSTRLSEVAEMESESGSDEAELEELSNAESVMDLLLMDGQDQDAFDLADCLATDIMNHERAELEVAGRAELIAKALAEEAERAKALEIMWATG